MNDKDLLRTSVCDILYLVLAEPCLFASQKRKIQQVPGCRSSVDRRDGVADAASSILVTPTILGY